MKRRYAVGKKRHDVLLAGFKRCENLERVLHHIEFAGLNAVGVEDHALRVEAVRDLDGGRLILEGPADVGQKVALAVVHPDSQPTDVAACLGVSRLEVAVGFG